MRIFALAALVAALTIAGFPQEPRTLAPLKPFTYQGKLTLANGLPADGDFDFLIKVFDQLQGGSELTEGEFPAVHVVNGIFTIPLNFDPAIFASNELAFLDVQVRVQDGNYFQLMPRLQIGYAPYASTADSSRSLQCLGCVSDSQIISISGSKVSGTVANATNAATAATVSGIVGVNHGGTGSATQNFVDLTTNQSIAGNKSFTGTIAGNGSAITSLTPGNITPGVARVVPVSSSTITAGSTPDVTNLTLLNLNYALPTTITGLSGGVDGQCVTLLTLNGNASLYSSSGLFLVDKWSPAANSTITVCKSGTNWVEKARAANSSIPVTFNVTNNTATSVAFSANGQVCSTFPCTLTFSKNANLNIEALLASSQEVYSWAGCGPYGSGCLTTADVAKTVTIVVGPKKATLEIKLENPSCADIGYLANIAVISAYQAGNTDWIQASDGCSDPTVDTVFRGRFTPGSPIQVSSILGVWFSMYNLPITWVVGSGSCVNVTQNCTLTAPAAGQTLQLTAHQNFGSTIVSAVKTGTGSGVVSSASVPMNCGATCSVLAASSVPVTLTATPDADSTFAGWNGACTGTAANCTFSTPSYDNTTSIVSTATATFAKTRQRLYVSKQGNGNGTITVGPTGSYSISCSGLAGSICFATYPTGSSVTLKLRPGTGSHFLGWIGGGCDDVTGDECTVTMNQLQTVQGYFALNTGSLSNSSGNASQKISTTPKMPIRLTGMTEIKADRK